MARALVLTVIGEDRPGLVEALSELIASHEGSWDERRMARLAGALVERGDRVVGVLREVAASHDTSPARVALAWLLHQPGVTSVIIGARKLHQLEDNLQAAELELSAEELQRLDEVSALTPEYPHWMPPMPRTMTVEERWGLS